MESDQSGGFKEVLNSSGLRASKRISEGISGGDTIDEDPEIKKARVSDAAGGDDQEVKIEQGPSLKSGVFVEEENGVGGSGENVTGSWIDLNFPAISVEEENGCDGSGECNVGCGGSGECNVAGSGIDLNFPNREVIDISSDDDDDDDDEGETENLENLRDDKGKGKEIDFGRGINESDFGGSNGGRRYSREEKGKGIVDDLHLPLPLVGDARKLGININFVLELAEADQLSDLNYLHEQEQQHPGQREEDAVEALFALNIPIKFEKTPKHQERETVVPVDQERIVAGGQEIQREADEQRLQQEVDEQRRREANERKLRWEAEARRDRIRRAENFAHFDADQEIFGDGSYYNRRQRENIRKPSNEAKPKLEQLSGPFSSALKAIVDQNEKRNPENLIKWKARDSSFQPHNIVPSLLDLSLDALAKNANAISSLDYVPEWLRRRLTNLLCDTRKMDIHMLELLSKDSPAEIRVKDCSWMTGTQLVMTLGKADLRNLRVLQLDLCGQCPLDALICNSSDPFLNRLPCLEILSLRGAGRLSDDTLKPILEAAPLLQSINLGESALLSGAGIEILANSLKTNLRELYIDDCPRMDAMSTLPSLEMFEHLQVLSVAGIETVCDEFVRGIVAACGGSLREFNLAGCLHLTDQSMETIGNRCPELCSLNISKLHNLTDLGIHYLANGCRSLQSLDLTRNKFSDEAIAAFLETSGRSLEELSLNYVREVSFNTALSLAKCSRNLRCLDVSWCRKLTNEALGLIVDSCLSLRLLKLFGCTQITDTFVHGHSNSQVHIVGLNMTPLLKHVNIFEPVDVLLRYPPQITT